MESTEQKYDNGFKGEEQEATVEYTLAHGHNQLERGLKSRHIQFLALGMPSLLVALPGYGEL